MITVHRNGTKTTFRHYRIQDIARLLEHFLQVILIEGNFTNKLGVFASSISWKLPFRTRTHTHTHSGDKSTHEAMPFVWQEIRCKLWIKYTWYCMCGQCWSLLINQIYKSHLPETETQQNLHWFHVISNLRTLHIFMLRHVETSKTGSISSWTTLW